jgi:hypothetical protein
LRTDYLAQYRSLMNTRSGAYSGFVAGRGNLNSKQANSRNAALDKAMQRFDTWTAENADRVHKAVLAARTPEQVKALTGTQQPPRSKRRPTKRLPTSRRRCSSS